MKPSSLGYGRHVIDDEDIAAVVATLRGDFLTQGPTIDRFEQAMADYVGARYAVACANGTAALHLACLAAGACPGTRTLTQTITFVASANATLYCGGEVDVVDIDPDTLGMSLRGLRAALDQRPDTRIVVPVHIGGLAADMVSIREIAGERMIIEDACHAFGGRYLDGSRVGNCRWSAMTCFSFHPVKPFTTAEGGAITTNDPELNRRLRLLRSHGIERSPDRFADPEAAFDQGVPNPWYYEQQALGFNYRLTDMQAALGLSQLGKLDGFLDRRLAIAKRYDDAFSELPHVRPLQSLPDQRERSGLHLYLVSLDFTALGLSRREAMERLLSEGIGTQVHYIPVHRQPFHAKARSWDRADFPVAESYYRGCLSLPLHPALDEGDIDRVIHSIAALLNQTLATR